MKTTLLTLSLTALLVGCEVTPQALDPMKIGKPAGTSSNDAALAEGQCLKFANEAAGQQTISPQTPGPIIWQNMTDHNKRVAKKASKYFAACMRDKGYTVTMVKKS